MSNKSIFSVIIRVSSENDKTFKICIYVFVFMVNKKIAFLSFCVYLKKSIWNIFVCHDAFHVWLFSYTFYVILLRETYKVKQLQVLIYKDFNMSHHCGSGRNSYKWGAPLLWWMWLSTSKSHKLCIISYFISCLTSLLHFSAALSDVCNHCSFFLVFCI